MTIARRTLPQRRMNTTFEFDHDMERGGAVFKYKCTLGYFEDGMLGEIFLNLNKHGVTLDASVQESAIIASIALQHGVPLATLRGAIARDPLDYPASPLGMAMDEIVRLKLEKIDA